MHDGTQAQLVTLAMRLGQAKEKLAEGGQANLDQARRLVDDFDIQTAVGQGTTVTIARWKK